MSVLPALSKIYEKVVADQVYHAFASSLLPNLSGYLTGHSYCTALLKLVEDWRLSLGNREAVATLAIDLSKAFDSVCHGLLLAKLRAYGFTDQALELTSNNLKDSRQRVKLDGIYSDWKPIKVGVPQGSLHVGPFAFSHLH